MVKAGPGANAAVNAINARKSVRTKDDRAIVNYKLQNRLYIDLIVYGINKRETVACCSVVAIVNLSQ